MAYRRKQVTWKEPEARIPTKRMHPYVRTDELPSHMAAEYTAHLVPGSLWTARIPLTRNEMYIHYEQHELPYASHAYNYVVPNIAPLGAPVVYLGTVRVTEEGRNGPMMPLRHTFLGPYGRFMLTDLSLLQVVR